MKIITQPTTINAAGTPPKTIEEYIGAVNSRSGNLSIACMRSPRGWSEPGQRPEFDEYSVVLAGTLVVETENGIHAIGAGQAVFVEKGEWVRYGTPHEGGAEYISVCVPAFMPDLVHRDDG
jgi:ethanolamine utilization protein EutQ (cupin superfamily)